MKTFEKFFYGKLIAILKKSLISGQATLEYFVLLALMLSIALVSTSSFLPKMRGIIQGDSTQVGYSKQVANKIINPNDLINSDIDLPPAPTPIPEDIPITPSPDPGILPGIISGIVNFPSLEIDCPGLVYYNDAMAGGDTHLNGPLQLASGDGTIIKYDSSFETTEDMPNKLWQIKMMDLKPSDGSSDLDILVKYGGDNCENGPPTKADYDRIKNDPDFEDGTNGFYASNMTPGSGSNKTVQVHLNLPAGSTGCIYVMIVNAGTGKKKDKVGVEIEEAITNDNSAIYNPNTNTCFKKK